MVETEPRSFREHPDDRKGAAIQEELAAKHLRIGGETSAPEGIAQQHDSLPAVILLRCEPASELRLNAQHAGHGCRHAFTLKALRLTCSGQCEAGVIVAADGFEGLGVRRQVKVVRAEKMSGCPCEAG